MANRRRDAAKTRSVIIATAQRQFTLNGFDSSNVRKIADEAGVDAAMINRYFGSKKGLFEKAVIAEISIDGLVELEKCNFGQTMAGLMVSKDMEYVALDPTLAFVQSIGSPTVGRLLAKKMDTEIVPKLAAWLGGKNAEQRATLILSEMMGFEIFRRIVRVTPLADKKASKAEKMLAKTLQAYVDGD